MDKRILIATILVLSLVGTASATNWSVDGSGGADFIKIQDAINNASDGDTIIVHSGVYSEKVVVNKSITLNGNGQPVVDAGGKGDAIIISAILSADGVTLEGFTVTNSESFGCCEGIMVSSSNNTITGNNVCNNNWGGIYLFKSGKNTISGNTFVNDGFRVDDSYQNTVEDNTVNGKPLVYLEDAANYRVTDAGQVILVNCTNLSVENLDLSNTSVGIKLWKTTNSRISNNNLSNNNDGIRLDYSSNNTISGNNACNNNWHCISLHESSNNCITGNDVCNNDGVGIDFDYSSSSSNNIYLNNFINNTDNVNSINVDSVASTNIWNLPSGITYTYNGTTYESYLGNYWDDYEGTDADGDGIGDTAYSIGADKDFYPLMQPQQNYVREENFRNGIPDA